ncbi:MAG TPA: GGDEF domain-containing protein [Polyangiaceae bacterium]|nr:GGDEF domain-containing protein [Polyangiaceae bacterium]
MFFKKSASQELPVPSLAPSSLRVAPDDPAIDCVAGLVRSYGKGAIDTDGDGGDSVTKQCDQWASQIAMGRPAANDEGSASGLRRDYGGLLSFFERTRASEVDFFNRSLHGLRGALQQFAACLAYSLSADRKADGGLEEQLQTLASALDSNNPDQIRANADRVLKAARLTLLERRQREARQVEILAQKFNQLKSELVEARSQATTDALTQLYNRNAFEQHLERIADWGVLFQHPPTLILADVDHFKSINDSYGHPFGDTVLRAVGDTLTRSFLRRQDFVARYGGEEFAVVAVETQPETLQTMAERLLDNIRKLDVRNGALEVEVTVSLGIARLRQGERPAQLIERADEALYEAKRRGRDRMVQAA